MPVVEEGAGGKWTVIEKSADHAPGESNEQNISWWIILKYVPGEDGRRIKSTDIRAKFDGQPLPFTFDEEDQILKAQTEAAFGPSTVHSFTLDPSEDSAFSFPSFELEVR